MPASAPSKRHRVDSIHSILQWDRNKSQDLLSPDDPFYDVCFNVHSLYTSDVKYSESSGQRPGVVLQYSAKPTTEAVRCAERSVEAYMALTDLLELLAIGQGRTL